MKRDFTSTVESVTKSRRKVREDSPVNTPVALGQDDPLCLGSRVLSTTSLSVPCTKHNDQTRPGTDGIPILSVKRQRAPSAATGILDGGRVAAGDLGERELAGMVPGVCAVGQRGDRLGRR